MFRLFKKISVGSLAMPIVGMTYQTVADIYRIKRDTIEREKIKQEFSESFEKWSKEFDDKTRKIIAEDAEWTAAFEAKSKFPK